MAAAVLSAKRAELPPTSAAEKRHASAEFCLRARNLSLVIAEADVVAQLRALHSGDPQLPYADAVRKLRCVCRCHTPRAKASALVRACESVADAAQQHLSKDRPVGADDLVPLLIYVVVRSRVPRLAAELALVAELMPSELHLSKEGYALATVQSACHALNELDNVDLGFSLGADGVPEPLRAGA